MSGASVKKQKILTTKSAVMYGVGILGVQLGIGLVNSYQAEFFNKILGANLMIVAAIILAAKFLSMAADFVIGNLIDRCHMKGGKIRPWLMISAWPLTLMTMVSFIYVPFASDAGRYVYIMFVTVLWNITMSLADIPSQGMLALLSPDGAERNNAAGFANTLRNVSLGSSGVFATVICMMTGSGSLGRTEYLILAGVMCGIGLILYLLMYFFCRENVAASESSAMSFKQMFLELKHNKMLIIVFLTFLLGFGRTIGLTIAVQASTILLREGVNLGPLGNFTGDGLSWLIALTCAVSSMIVIVLMPVINKKWGEKKSFLVFGIYGFFVSVISFCLYAFGGAPFRTLWAILIYQLLIGPAYGPNSFLPLVMVSDIVDYREWQSGKRTEGAQFAVLSLGNKIAYALAISVGIFLVGAIGFSSEKYYAVRDSGEAISNYVTNGMQTSLWAIYFLIPGVCMLLSCIPMLWYKIDKATKEKMRAELAERRVAAEQAACDKEFNAV